MKGIPCLNRSLQLNNLYYTEAVDLLLDKAATYDSNDLNITVISPQAEELISGIESCDHYGQYESHCSEADSSEHYEAHALGISVAKYRIYLQLLQYNPDLTPEECGQLSMRQLRDLLAQYTSDTTGDQNSPTEESSVIPSQTCPTDADKPGNGKGSHGSGQGNGHRKGQN